MAVHLNGHTTVWLGMKPVHHEVHGCLPLNVRETREKEFLNLIARRNLRARKALYEKQFAACKAGESATES